MRWSELEDDLTTSTNPIWPRRRHAARLLASPYGVRRARRRRHDPFNNARPRTCRPRERRRPRRPVRNPDENGVTVSVEDARFGDRFHIAVAPDRALDAFYHPYAYAA